MLAFVLQNGPGLALRADLAGCELVIERGRKAFVEVGAALMEVRERELYRETHGTFEAYCADRWGFSRVHAWRLMEAADVVATLPMGNIPAPASERQVRELARAPEAERPAVWQEAVARAGGEAPPARVVADVIEDRTDE